MGRQEVAIRLALLTLFQARVAADGHDSQQVGGDDRQVQGSDLLRHDGIELRDGLLPLHDDLRREESESRV